MPEFKKKLDDINKKAKVLNLLGILSIITVNDFDTLEEALSLRMLDLKEEVEDIDIHNPTDINREIIMHDINMINDIYLVVQKYKNKIENKELLS
jgi:hypothetical protein